MSGEIPIRALMGSLGVESWDGQQVILGTRVPFNVNPSVSVPANSAAGLSASFTVPKMSATDALWVEHAGASIFPTDASGKLVLAAVFAGIGDTTSGTNLPMETFATLGAMPAVSLATAGVFMQPPPPVRCRDFVGGKPGDTITVFLGVTVSNTDAVAHTFAIILSGFVRIISGVSA